MSALHALENTKLWPAIGTGMLTLSGILQAANLDTWGHDHFPWLGFAAVLLTGVGTPLAAIGRSLTATQQRRATDPPTTDTAELRAADGPEA